MRADVRVALRMLALAVPFFWVPVVGSLLVGLDGGRRVRAPARAALVALPSGVAVAALASLLVLRLPEVAPTLAALAAGIFPAAILVQGGLVLAAAAVAAGRAPRELAARAGWSA